MHFLLASSDRYVNNLRVEHTLHENVKLLLKNHFIYYYLIIMVKILST